MSRSFALGLAAVTSLCLLAPSAHASVMVTTCAKENIIPRLSANEILPAFDAGKTVATSDFEGVGMCFKGQLDSFRGLTLAQKFKLDQKIPDFKGLYAFLGKVGTAFSLVQPIHVDWINNEFQSGLSYYAEDQNDKKIAENLCGVSLKKLKHVADEFRGDKRYSYSFDAATEMYYMTPVSGTTESVPPYALNLGDGVYTNDVRMRETAAGMVILVHTSEVMNRYLICQFRPLKK